MNVLEVCCVFVCGAQHTVHGTAFPMVGHFRPTVCNAVLRSTIEMSIAHSIHSDIHSKGNCVLSFSIGESVSFAVLHIVICEQTMLCVRCGCAIKVTMNVLCLVLYTVCICCVMCASPACKGQHCTHQANQCNTAHSSEHSIANSAMHSVVYSGVQTLEYTIRKHRATPLQLETSTGY